MKTIDLSYDFLASCGDEHDDIMTIIKSIELDTENEKIEFLRSFLVEAKKKYSADELYLLNRLEYHVSGVAQRNESGEKANKVEFEAPAKRPSNPLLR